METPLLTSKLRLPPARPHVDVVPRWHLWDLLSAGAQRRVTLLSAPAGFGKTTTLSEWLHRQALPAAWLTLDENDDDPVRFWHYLIAACQSVFPEIGQTALRLLQAPPPVNIEAVVANLLNDLVVIAQPLYLVVDDYQLITTEAIHASVAYWIDHLAATVHLLLVTRADPPLPLARLRARGQLTELRAEQLRFSLDEAAAFLNQVMQLRLAANEVATLESRTEGWVAALQLAALSLQNQADAAAFIQDFAGSHRHVTDYLLEEVLNQLPSEMQNFLLQTSVLDQLTGPLCDAVTGRSNSAARLAQLERANLFVTALDEQRQWYRYHRLFAELLRSQLSVRQPEAPAILHQRASQWYEQAGNLDAAVQHAFAIPDVARAAYLVEEYGAALLNGNRLNTLLSWVQRIPAEGIEASSYLCMGCGWVYALTQQIDRAERYLAAGEAALASFVPRYIPGDGRIVTREEIRADLAAVRAYCARARGDAAGVYSYSQQALAQLPLNDQTARGAVALNLGLLHFENDELDEAQQRLAEAAELALAVDGNTLIATTALNLRGNILREVGLLREAAACYSHLITLEIGTASAAASAAYLGQAGLAEIHYLRAEVAEAVQHSEAALQLARLDDNQQAQATLLQSYLLRAQVALLTGDLLGTEDWLTQADRYAGAHPLGAPRTDRLIVRGELCLARGDLAGAVKMVEDTVSVETRQHLSERLLLARIKLAQGKIDQAVVELDRLVTAASDQRCFLTRLEVTLLQAVAQLHLKNTAQARQHLVHALALAEPEGYVLPFVRAGEVIVPLLRQVLAQESQATYAQKILGAVNVHLRQREAGLLHEPISGALIEPLTERERQILRLLATGLSSTRIAAELVIAVSTTRSYLKSIYRKLDAHSRDEAVARARTLGWL